MSCVEYVGLEIIDNSSLQESEGLLYCIVNAFRHRSKYAVTKKMRYQMIKGLKREVEGLNQTNLLTFWGGSEYPE